MDLIRRNGTDGDATRRYDAAFSNSDAGAYERSGAHPGSILHNDWIYSKAERSVGPVVVACAEIGALGDTHVPFDNHRSQIVDPNIFAYP